MKSTGILLDENLKGCGRRLERLIAVAGLSYFQQELGIAFYDPDAVGLLSNDSDRKVWLLCQSLNLYLLTDNRNQIGRDSLEEVVRTLNQPDSLPVFTVGNKDAFLFDSVYATKALEHLIVDLLSPENIAGTGRLYIPKGGSA